jgi:hypothetical protein
VLDDEGAVRDGLAHAPPGRRQQPAVARAVSVAVLSRLEGPRALRVLGTGRGAVHLDLDGFVVSVTGRRVPMMANAIAVAAQLPPAAVTWDPAAPPAWDPVVPPLVGGPERVAELATWLAARVEVPDLTPDRAAARLLGRGPGLTPEGDDVLGGAAVAARALGPAAGASPERVAALVAVLCPPDARARTGALSATLLSLAAEGAAPEPAHRLVHGADREGALADLSRLGSSTGRAVAAGIALGARFLIEGTGAG